MAARLNRLHQEQCKEKIKTSQLINRLQNHALGEIEMTSTQLDAAKFLLNKQISNAAQIVESTVDANVTVSKIEVEIVNPSR